MVSLLLTDSVDTPCETMSLDICGQTTPRSACKFTQSDHGFHCPLTESLDTTECMNGEQRPGYFTHVQDDLNLRILHMSKSTFTLDAANDNRDRTSYPLS